ncbi:helix-turn-helix domain-containing protein [Mucilaginibacter sp.]|uniref:helix-turn-helix domain-containing protein n=1 Tax=Mucilaginibacter sp. TaxID=1882438 RepID=UPI000CA7682B|nr:AraC family transcriptional regulator [Mucilaginibacter sp.]PLW90769.1 MAG: AraC family transcriptional regulator [Mucilaginibacter sp.]HEK21996.1 AraC family transcriptional regulator [Bacteroidota bacterium]
MISPEEILPGVLFYSYLSAVCKEKVCLWNYHTLVMQLSGTLTLQTATQRISISAGETLLIAKNQVGTLSKQPPPGGQYETIVISLQEDLLRRIALEEKIAANGKYTGPLNRLVPVNEFLQGYFKSVVPYARESGAEMTDKLGILKVKEGVTLLIDALPALRDLFFDFSEPHKIDLEKFMLHNFHFNIPVEQFALITGRSLAGFKRDFRKTFNSAPRQWLQGKRLEKARYLIQHERKKPSAIYLDLGFKSLSHFSYSFKEKYGVSPNQLTS